MENRNFFVRILKPIHDFKVGELVELLLQNGKLILVDDAKRTNVRVVPYDTIDLVV